MEPDDLYNYHKLRGEIKFKYNKYNHTHGWNSRSSMSRAYRYGHDVRSHIRISDRYEHHRRRNIIRDLISHDKIDRIQYIYKITLYCRDKYILY